MKHHITSRLAIFHIAICVLLSISTTSFAQTQPEKYEVTLTKHITAYQEYPPEAEKYSIEGDAIIQVVINQDGTILAYKLLKKPGNPLLKAAIIDMIKAASPTPKPPQNILKNGKAAFMFPIAFRMNHNPNSLRPIDALFQQKVKEAWQESIN